MHDVSVIVTLAGALGVALAFGWATQRLGLSTLVGYLLAGVVVGPQTPGFVADAQLASQMAEIGVILLMFGVGMHFHPEQLLRVWRIAVPGAIGQSAIAGAIGWAAARAFGWSHVAGMVFGMALAVASTVVLMRMLVEQDRLSTRDGHVAVGWLIVEDLFTVVALVILPVLAAEHTNVPAASFTLGLAIGKVAVFAAIVWALGTRLVAPIMERIARTRSAELFTLMVFVIALGIAILASEVFNISVALGAFFAGLVVGQSRFGAQAAADMTPFRDVFSALFFVSVGMLFNPEFVLSQPLMVLAALAIVLLVKPLVALAIVMILRDTTRTALTVAVGLAQIGEFSFILAALGSSLKILPPEGMDALIAAALVSIAVNPLLFRAAHALERRLGPAVADEAQTEAASEHASDGRARAIPVIVTGLGELGQRLARRCTASGVQVCIIDDRDEALEEFRCRGVATVAGDPGDEKVLRKSGVADARVLVVTSTSLAAKMRACIAARAINPRIAIVATSESAAERAWLEEFGAAYVCDALDEMSDAMLRAIRSGV
ncbi:MAG: cation:proton antiporter [Betaproteobacteria bacterium]|nr:cation:proton antiporter [Betaproteobacteria bacterium]